jgi:hypothetical protein
MAAVMPAVLDFAGLATKGLRTSLMLTFFDWRMSFTSPPFWSWAWISPWLNPVACEMAVSQRWPIGLLNERLSRPEGIAEKLVVAPVTWAEGPIEPVDIGCRGCIS